MGIRSSEIRPNGYKPLKHTSCERNGERGHMQTMSALQNDLQINGFVNNICRSASFAMYRIGQIRKCLDRKSTEILVHAFITCRLDQCNSLLYGLPADTQISKLQRIQNSAARLVTLIA